MSTPEQKMMSDEEKRAWDRRVEYDATFERDKLQAQLDDIRGLRREISHKNRDDLREYRMKLGELSFVVGAAILPVIIVVNSKVQNVGFAIVGVALYLASGLVLLWRNKTILYQDAEDAPQIGLDVEIMLLPVIHAYNKVIHDPWNDSYKDECITASKTLTDNSLDAQKRLRKPRADFAVDLGLYGFIGATLLVARTVWPFPATYYWIMLGLYAAFVITSLILGCISLFRRRHKLQMKREKVNNEMAKYQEWHNNEIFKR